MLPSDPKKEEIYVCRSLMWKYSTTLNNVNAQGLSKWCGARKLELNLMERSLVTKVFASASCDANQPLLNTDMLSKITADGDMQDLLAYIRTRDKICIAVIDFAGLTTDSEDLEQFLSSSLTIRTRNKPNVVKLIVGKLPY
ncbi:hypothetical protein A0J61_11647 [Choanephora cucurbitarum]|uniref:Uncharacterized protein n=1 Tax=Choanephora cucurbitarum TaxID=101091 RepID=A0A1C7MYV7_9FUNG|nr:hypothetical protein A0J61_11647 [Choanephora cucurbitarum]